MADLAAERARLNETNVMRFAGRPAADNAGPRGYERTLRCSASCRAGEQAQCDSVGVVRQGRSPPQLCRRSEQATAPRPEKRFLQRMLTAGPPRETKRPQSLRSGRGNPIDPVTVSCDQRVLGREVGVDPICGLVGDLELTETGEQPLRATPPMVLIKAGWMRLSLPRGAAASQPSEAKGSSAEHFP